MAEKIKDQPRRKMGRPSALESQQLDEQVKACALNLFLDHGFDGVSMEAVAKAANITKRSLYARYSDKSELFVAALKHSKHAWAFDVSGLDLENSNSDNPSSANKSSLTESLLQIADALMAQAVDPMYIKVARMAAAVANQFPETVQQTYDIGLSPRLQSIKQILHRYQDEIAAPYVDNLELTAELFLGLISGLPARLASFGMIRAPEIEKQRVQLAVAIFVRGIA